MRLIAFINQWLACRRIRADGYRTLRALQSGGGATQENKDFYIDHYKNKYGKDSFEFQAFSEGWLAAIQEDLNFQLARTDG